MPKGVIYHRWGDRQKDKRNWRAYNKQLVRRGELMISIDFIENWGKERERMNLLKSGRKFRYPETFIRWAALAYHTMNLPYRTLQGFIRSIAAIVPKLKLPITQLYSEG
ncbi:MAG: transposase [Thermoplasmatota archaeon]